MNKNLEDNPIICFSTSGCGTAKLTVRGQDTGSADPGKATGDHPAKPGLLRVKKPRPGE